MKTLAIILFLAFTTTLFATSNEKFYQVTNDGQFQYTYWKESGADNCKAGSKPVTLRTFFLETSKNGLLPEGMTYYDFMKLSVEEKQAVVTNSQMQTIAAMENNNEMNTANNNIIATKPIATAQEVSTETMTQNDESVATSNEQKIDLDAKGPWLVTAITRPGTEKNLPTDKVKMAVSEKNNELPWAVDVMLNDGEQTNARIMTQIMKSSSGLTAGK